MANATLLAMLLKLPSLKLPLAEFFDDFSLFSRVGERGASLVDLPLHECHFLCDGQRLSLHRSGEWLDGMMYALLADEWEPRRAG